MMAGHPIVWALVEQERRKSLMFGKSQKGSVGVVPETLCHLLMDAFQRYITEHLPVLIFCGVVQERLKLERKMKIQGNGKPKSPQKTQGIFLYPF